MADEDKTEQERERVERLRARFRSSHPAWAGFAFAAVLSAVFVGIDARGVLPSGDEWDYFHRLATQPLPQALFDAPVNKYLLAVPLFTVYLPQAEIFGIGEALPLRMAGVGLVVIVAGLVMELTRRRAGYGFGLAAGILLLFFGAAGEVLATPQRIPGLMATAFGLGMLLALDRQDRRGDVTAAVCGVLGVASHPVMLPFLAGAGVRALFGKRQRIKRSALVLAPAVAVFGAWRLAVYEQSQAVEPTFEGIVEFAGDHFVALIASITGLFRGPFVEGTDFVNGASMAVAILSAVALVLVIVRRRGLTLGLAAALAILAAALAVPPLGPSGSGPFSSPDESRYIHPGAVIVLFLLAELVAAGKPFPRRSGVAVAAAALVWLVLAVPANVAELHKRADIAAASGDLVRAELGALELARTVPGSIADQAENAEPTQAKAKALCQLEQLHSGFGALQAIKGVAQLRAPCEPVFVGNDRQAEIDGQNESPRGSVVRGKEVLQCRLHAVAGTALDRRVVQQGVDAPRRHQLPMPWPHASLRVGMAELRRDAFGPVVEVAAAVRPAHVVKDQQG